MHTQVKSPQDIFFLPQRLIVPLFQRPYVWSLELQWQPLWEDVTRLSDRIMAGDGTTQHFLGAVVIQQEHADIGQLTTRAIVDGQQRLTTLQLLIDAVHDSLVVREFDNLAAQLNDLVRNKEYHSSGPDDVFKVWPTNRDRAAFSEVISAVVDDEMTLTHADSKMAQAHHYFRISCNEYLDVTGERALEYANALVQAISRRLQIVVIELEANEDAQEIFETLNARGTPLSAADLIKNFVFQRLNVSPQEQEKIYHEKWERFETPFWETEISSGRVNYTRSSLFLTQWLTSQLKQDVTAREVFGAFKRHILDSDAPVLETLDNIKDNAIIYRQLTERSQEPTAVLTPEEMFFYRMSALQSEVFKPVMIWLLDASQEKIGKEQLTKAINVIESWLIRRMLVRVTSKGNNRLAVDLLQAVSVRQRAQAGDNIEKFFREQTSEVGYWPGDAELRRSLETTPIYNNLSRARLRVVLEAIEDRKRGYPSGKAHHEAPVIRGKCTIEHVLPQKWDIHWKVETPEEEITRADHVNLLGNLTLLTQVLNSEVSNAPWLGADGKREKFDNKTTMLLTADVKRMGEHTWDERLIRERTNAMITDIETIWPVPDGHVGTVTNERNRAANKVSVLDLVNTNLVQTGQKLYARVAGHRGKTCEIAPDGRLYIDDKAYTSLSGAAKAITKTQSEAGWWFWLVNEDTQLSMSDLRRDYLDLQGLGIEADDKDENVEEVATAGEPELQSSSKFLWGPGDLRIVKVPQQQNDSE